MSPREYVNWAVDRALYYFDQGERRNAVMSFYSDMHKAPETKWICDAPMTIQILEEGFDNGRQAFTQAMRGFNV